MTRVFTLRNRLVTCFLIFQEIPSTSSTTEMEQGDKNDEVATDSGDESDGDIWLQKSLER